MTRVRGGDALPADHPRHAEWLRERAEFDARMDRVVFWSWGLRPAEPEPMTLLSHMFLHGGIIHLVGNMLFLLAIGFLVEGAIGSRLMLAAYLLGGVLAGAADLVVAGDRFIPGVGASGASAAMMGMYCVLFGRTRVQFFYFVWVYFNVTRAPAILLLPLWLGYELASWLWLGDESNINYAAHASGLVAGALMAAAIGRFRPSAINRAYVTEQRPEDAPEHQLAQADAHLRARDPERAQPLLEALVRDYPAQTQAEYARNLMRQIHGGVPPGA
ncbi:MAG: rhomboid family intramembrane serine protease [Ectothiorhodospiraceae bacterium]|nr:rhomboid family intramembrane serine protease [Ectothiorhodospiraceae bacterium]